MDDQSISNLNPDNESKGPGLTWIVIIAVIVVGVVAFLLTSFFREQPTTEITPQANPPAEANQAAVANPAEPGSAQAQFEHGNSLVEAGNFQEAISAYQRAIELDPEFQAVYANLGVVYYQLEQLDLAAEQYQKALELDPTDGEVTYNLGALNLQRALTNGSTPDPVLIDEAVAQLQKALELSPDLAEPYFSLGVAYAIQQQNDKAIAAFEEFLAKNTGTDPRANQEAQRYLDTLKAE
jgi:tetratricopeptide (TPR) repeat protein